MHVVETIEHKGHTIQIVLDECGESPREWDNLCEFHYGHRSHILGDTNHDSRESMEEMKKDALEQGDLVWAYYAYIHSGVTISFTPFSCPWDSGQAGWVVVRKAQMLEEFGGDDWTPELRQKAEQHAKAEIETYDQFLRGEVYGYVIDDDESCYGFYGMECVTEEAKSTVDAMVEHRKAKQKKCINDLCESGKMVL